MSLVTQMIAEIPADERRFYEWQFSLSIRILQIIEEYNISESDFAHMVNISEEELDDLIHMCSDPPLSVIARIEALSKCKVLTWVNADVRVEG